MQRFISIGVVLGSNTQQVDVLGVPCLQIQTWLTGVVSSHENAQIKHTPSNCAFIWHGSPSVCEIAKNFYQAG